MNFDDILMRYKFKAAFPYIGEMPLLDVGCGTGHFIHLMNHYYEDMNFWGIDINCRKIQVAREFIRGTFYCMDFERTNYENRWGTITAFNVLEHVRNSGLFIQRCYESLVDGGKLIITVPNAIALHKRIGAQMGLSIPYRLTEDDHKKGHLRVYDLGFLQVSLRFYGFKIVCAKGIFLKPLSSDMMMKFYSEKLFDALYEVGNELPEYCSSIMVVGEKR